MQPSICKLFSNQSKGNQKLYNGWNLNFNCLKMVDFQPKLMALWCYFNWHCYLTLCLIKYQNLASSHNTVQMQNLSPYKTNGICPLILFGFCSKYYAIFWTSGVKYKITQMIFWINKKWSLLLIIRPTLTSFCSSRRSVHDFKVQCVIFAAKPVLGY